MVSWLVFVIVSLALTFHMSSCCCY